MGGRWWASTPTLHCLPSAYLCSRHVSWASMPTFSIQQAHDLALQRHQAGDLSAALAMYEQILRLQPDHADTLNMLALLESQRGNLSRALELISRAIAIDSSQAA